MKNFIVFVATIIFLSSCSTLKITHNLDTGVDFSKYKTYSYYGWDSTSTNINKYYQREIEYSFAEEFNKRGLTYDASGNGDIVISLFLVIDVDKGVKAYSNYYGHSPYGFYQPGWGWGYGYRAPYAVPYTYGGVVYEEYNYVTGTLVCDVFDREQKKIVWQGVASKSIDSGKEGKNISKIISRLMLKFPIEKIKE